MKLSKTQLEVIDLMSNGYELGYSSGLKPSAWLQEGKIGYGGKSAKLSVATFWSLKNKRLLKLVKKGFPTDSYMLIAEFYK